MAEMTIDELESKVRLLGFVINKKYDGVKGVCTVTLVSTDGHTTITDANRSMLPLWRAYRKALQFAYEQLTQPR
jgi:hypothetical protein